MTTTELTDDWMWHQPPRGHRPGTAEWEEEMLTEFMDRDGYEDDKPSKLGIRTVTRGELGVVGMEIERERLLLAQDYAVKHGAGPRLAYHRQDLLDVRNWMDDYFRTKVDPTQWACAQDLGIGVRTLQRILRDHDTDWWQERRLAEGRRQLWRSRGGT